VILVKKETSTMDTLQIFSTVEIYGNYRFLSSDYDIWFIFRIMTAIEF